MPWQVVLSLLLLVGLVAFYGWYEAEYPCLRSEVRWVQGHVELIPMDDQGNQIPILTPASYQYVCVERSPGAR